MANTFFGLTIGKSGLYTYQAALNTAAHNASNIDTPGFSRQQAIRVASQAISMTGSYGMAGTGTDVSGIKQVRDAYYDVKFWNNSAIYGKFDCKAYYLKAIEGYFMETQSDGINYSFDQFFGAIKTLQTDPSDITKRTQVTEFGISLTETVNSLYDGLKSLQSECNMQIKDTADQINSIAERIASLTKQINTIEVRGAMANDLRDARNLLIDELSGLASVTVTETPMGEGIGINQYIVRLDGKTLVDTYEYTTLKVIPQSTSVNMNDTPGLYSLQWADGQNFDSSSKTLGGKLQGLFEMRDGNNKFNFTGKAEGAAGSNLLKVTGANIQDLMKLNIPESNGEIIVGTKSYSYESFQIKIEDDGSYTYEFKLKQSLENNVNNASSSIGQSVDAKGIPYYMAQLNEFVRTFAQAFNDVHIQGEDLLERKKGLDFFTATVPGTGEEYAFSYVGADGSDTKLTEIDSYAGAAGSAYKYSSDGKYVITSYYSMTAGNLKVNSAISEDPGLIAGAEYDADKDTGIGDYSNLQKLLDLKNDRGMFKQGTPNMFLQTMIGEMGVDGKAAITFAESQNNILKVIDGQRMSVSGVDSDEEAMDLMKFKNAYDLCSKVISVMNEIYNKLINETGV